MTGRTGQGKIVVPSLVTVHTDFAAQRSFAWAPCGPSSYPSCGNWVLILGPGDAMMSAPY